MVGLLGWVCLLGLACGTSFAADSEAKQWLPYEVVLNAIGGYGNPYKDVEVNVTFVPADTARRYLVNARGEPFFWLGDTHWSGFSLAEHTRDNNDPFYNDSTSMFQEILTRRVAQGYTVWKAESFANNDEGVDCAGSASDGSVTHWHTSSTWTSLWVRECQAHINRAQTVAFPGGNAPINHGGPAWINNTFFSLPNPAFWQDIDDRVALVNQAGLLAALAVGIGRSMPTNATLADHMRLSKYFFARYAAFNTVWLTCQEYCTSTACPDCWATIAATIWSMDPYRRPNSMHNCATNPIAYHDQPWYSFVTLQLGHGSLASVDHWLAQYNATPARAIIEDEANYELLVPPYQPVTSEMTRQTAWQAVIGGSFGYTYGGQGLWWGCWNRTYVNGNCGTVGSSAYKTWNETLHFPTGVTALGHWRDFWSQLPWWQLAPDGLVAEWSVLAPRFSQKPYQKSTPDRSVVVAYLPPSPCGTYTGMLHLPVTTPAPYSVFWFNVTSGEYLRLMTNVSGSVAVPEAPSTSDWALLATTNASHIDMARTHAYGRQDSEHDSRFHAPAASWHLVANVTSLGTPRQGPATVGLNFSLDEAATAVALGRYKLPDNGDCHQLSLYGPDGRTLVAQAYVNMAAAADANGFVYAGLVSPVRLQPGVPYYLVDNNSGPDSFANDDQTRLVPSTAGSISSSVFGGPGTFQAGGGGPNSGYGPVDLVFELASSQVRAK
ncbi:uncharacterized protein MONBRDRAFT_26886 [Monosiga brevicollis MX1]|uniref:DUF4038 domain-containing protein n=1 Tax=Monosiga brevicollis TaxID=81824 RepID=A9V3T9_MONBE|nr:uncharacterized protein MONBRDRAFT_26886 [Monosiga brevicollis MX1]EDQ87766.1 predicted protein [Monosiga brevicollis MX1]|eukprot:XP_001747299.1 hypothetical protein [Monosiga brevicollis MX1]